MIMPGECLVFNFLACSVQLQVVAPRATILHIFDYPHEEDNLEVRNVCADFGTVKGVKRQTYLSNSEIFTGTRLVTVILSSSPPRFLSINGYNCRV